MNYPVYVLDGEDTVPLPGGEVHIDIPLDKASSFRAEGPSVKKVVVIACSQGHNWDLMTDPVALTQTANPIGCLCIVERREQAPDFELITLVGERRVRLMNFVQAYNGCDVEVQPIAETFSSVSDEEVISDLEGTLTVIQRHQSSYDHLMLNGLKNANSLERKMDVLAHFMLSGQPERLLYLFSESPQTRWELVSQANIAHVHARAKKQKKDTKPQAVVANKLAKEDWAGRLAISKVTPDAREKLTAEIKRYNLTPDASGEKPQLAAYLDTALTIPWGTYSNQPLDIEVLQQQMDSTHYGLEDVKSHILEHMVVEKRAGNSAGTVLCFSGPAGTGKTTIAKTIAAATGRKLIRLALGGISDEAEIRGFRRTYMNSKEGKIINGLKAAQTMDPLFLLDEVDKLRANRGDPAAALLELLDPEQNKEFLDHYLEIPVDLSRAMFICTANDEDYIHYALRDRMEFLRFREYTVEERKYIAIQHIIPKLMAAYKITEQEVTFDSLAIELVITNPQLRQIEKAIGKALRQAAVRLDVKKEPHVLIDPSFFPDFKTPTQQRPMGF